MAERDFKLTFLGDSSKAEAAMSRVGGGLGDIEAKSGKVSGALGSMSKIAGGFVLGSALTQLPGFLEDAAKAAADDAASEARVKQAIINTGVAYSDKAKALQDSIKQGQALAFTDDQVRDSLSLLTAQTGSFEEAQKRLKLAMDLSRGANIDVVTASRLLGKVTDENVNVLARYGIKVEKGASDTELFAAIQQKFGGQSAAFAETTAGKYAIMTDKMHEFQEQLGTALIPVLDKLVPIAIKFVEVIAKVPTPILAAGVAIASAAAAAALLAPVITGLIALAPALGAAATIAFGPWGIIIAGVVAAGVLLYRHWDQIKAAASAFAGWIKGIFTGIADFFGSVFHAAVNSHLLKIALLFTPAGPLVALFMFKDRIKDALSGLLDLFKGIFGPVIDFIAGVGEKVGHVIAAVKNAVTGKGGAPGPVDYGTSDSGIKFTGFNPIEGYASGGIVPGPVGSPRLAVVHGGEEVLTPGQRGGGVNITIYGNLLTSKAELERLVLDAMQGARLRGALPA